VTCADELICEECCTLGGRHDGHVTASLGAVAAREKRRLELLLGVVRSRLDQAKSDKDMLKVRMKGIYK